jgi:HEAT repeat protein
MRPLIALATLVGVVSLSSSSQSVPKKEEIPKLIVVLKTSQAAKARASAAEDIGARGAIRASDVKDAIEPLVAGLKGDKDSDVRRACAKALGSTGSNADICVPALMEALKDSALAVKLAAIQALGQFGNEASSALPTLRDLAKMKDTKDDKKISQSAAAAAKAIVGNEKKK